MQYKVRKYYSRKDVQKEIFEAGKNREVAIQYGESFGKRPDILEVLGDVKDIVKDNATSFHVSEEHWSNPLLLKPGMSKRELDGLRTGWDCILDIDCKFYEYSKITAKLLIEAIQFHDIENIGLKFSGNRSFHIAIPFKSFPLRVNNIPTKDLFPDGVRVIASYLKKLIRDQLSEGILSLNSLKEIVKASGKSEKDLVKKGVFDPFKIVELDSILISSRHLYRSPYSLNEKSWLVSIPIKLKQLNNFKLSSAKIENVETGIKFLPKVETEEASTLIIQAFDWHQKRIKKDDIKTYRTISTELPKIAITNQEVFPHSINNMLQGIQKDGRKRAVFILITFLRNLGWSFDEIEKELLEWNPKNYEPLREGYIRSQVRWHKQQKKALLPPNYDNDAYYKDLGIFDKRDTFNNVKNPVNYTMRRVRAMEQKKKTRKRKKS